MEMTLQPIGFVHNHRQVPVDDQWDSIESRIIISDEYDEDCLDGIESFSHLEVIFYFLLAEESKIETGARHPRNNLSWPRVGIFAQRGKNRPNRLGLSMVSLLRREGRSLFVTGLDAVDGTPVLDIKPVMNEFLPREQIRQPQWSTELMQNYW